MAVIYESKRFPISFILQDIGGSASFVRNNVSGTGAPAYPLLAGPRNGSLASATSIYSIIENEHWLAMADPPMINFFEVAANGDTAAAGTAWANSTARVVKLIVPPFCRWASFHFLCSHDFGASAGENHHIKVVSAYHTAINPNIPWGEDLSASGKASLPYYAADWVHFQGIDLNETGGPAAVRLVEDATESAQWTTVDVTITPSAGVSIYAAAYRVLPAVGTMQVQT